MHRLVAAAAVAVVAAAAAGMWLVLLVRHVTRRHEKHLPHLK